MDAGHDEGQFLTADGNAQGFMASPLPIQESFHLAAPPRPDRIQDLRLASSAQRNGHVSAARRPSAELGHGAAAKWASSSASSPTPSMLASFSSSSSSWMAEPPPPTLAWGSSSRTQTASSCAQPMSSVSSFSTSPQLEHGGDLDQDHQLQQPLQQQQPLLIGQKIAQPEGTCVLGTLSSLIRVLTAAGDGRNVFMVRRIQRLPAAEQSLRLHFSAYGQVHRILLERAAARGARKQREQRRQANLPPDYEEAKRPSSLGFVQMKDAEAVRRVLEQGDQQVVDGVTICVTAFHHASVAKKGGGRGHGTGLQLQPASRSQPGDDQRSFSSQPPPPQKPQDHHRAAQRAAQEAQPPIPIPTKLLESQQRQPQPSSSPPPCMAPTSSLPPPRLRDTDEANRLMRLFQHGHRLSL